MKFSQKHSYCVAQDTTDLWDENWTFQLNFNCFLNRKYWDVESCELLFKKEDTYSLAETNKYSTWVIVSDSMTFFWYLWSSYLAVSCNFIVFIDKEVPNFLPINSERIIFWSFPNNMPAYFRQSWESENLLKLQHTSMLTVTSLAQ